jgi:hypothetical protein
MRKHMSQHIDWKLVAAKKMRVRTVSGQEVAEAHVFCNGIVGMMLPKVDGEGFDYRAWHPDNLPGPFELIPEPIPPSETEQPKTRPLGKGICWSVSWYSDGGHSTVTSSACDTPAEAFDEAVRFAFVIGYTTPKWWEFWRWREIRLVRPPS